MIRVKNPHSVTATLQCRPKDVLRVFADAKSNTAWRQVIELARKNQIPVSPPPQRGPVSSESGRESGSEAQIQELPPIPLEELFSNAKERAGGKGVWLALDELHDPHNAGAIFRSAAFFGVQGIVMTAERSAPISATVYDVASGGLEYVPFTIQGNLQRSFEAAKESGLWILGTSEHAHDDLLSIERDRPWLLVIGNEERGMRRLTEEKCDVLCRITPRGTLGSLNASVAAGVLIAHLSSGK